MNKYVHTHTHESTHVYVYLLPAKLNSKFQNTFYTRGEFKNEEI